MLIEEGASPDQVDNVAYFCSAVGTCTGLGFVDVRFLRISVGTLARGVAEPARLFVIQVLNRLMEGVKVHLLGAGVESPLEYDNAKSGPLRVRGNDGAEMLVWHNVNACWRLVRCNDPEVHIKRSTCFVH